MCINVGDEILIVSGLDLGAKYRVVSEPFNTSRRGDKAVTVECIKLSNYPGGIRVGEEMTMPLEDIERYGKVV